MTAPDAVVDQVGENMFVIQALFMDRLRRSPGAGWVGQSVRLAGRPVRSIQAEYLVE